MRQIAMLSKGCEQANARFSLCLAEALGVMFSKQEKSQEWVHKKINVALGIEDEEDEKEEQAENLEGLGIEVQHGPGSTSVGS